MQLRDTTSRARGALLLRNRPTTLAALLATLVLLAGGPSAAAAPGANPDTVVTFTFDDGTVSQTVGADILSKHGMRGTFYIVSGSIGSPGYLTRADLDRIAARGHEIGGHTVNHLDLTAVRPNEVRRQICHDRANLVRWGYEVTSFAAPFDHSNKSTHDAARQCGYNSSRTMRNLYSRENCPNCRPAESIPPADPYAIRSPGMLTPRTTVEDLQDTVRRVDAAGGGWMPLVLHQTCDFCGLLAVRPAVLNEFTDWLHRRGTAVRMVKEVIGGDVAPLVPAPPPPDRDTPVNASLELPSADGRPRGWKTGGWGRNTAVWTRTHDAHRGNWAERLDVTDHADGDAKLTSELDLGGESLPVRAGHNYALSVWYKSTAPTQLAVYYRDVVGRWRYWTPGPTFAPAPDWTQARWTTPPVPEEATGLSYGLALFSRGSLTTDDYDVEIDAEATNDTTCRNQQWWVPRRWLCP